MKFQIVQKIIERESGKIHKVVATLLLFITLSYVYGQKPQDNNFNYKNITELTDSIKQLQNQIQELKQEVQDLKIKQEWKNEILEERLKQASDTISNQNSLFDGFGVIYAIITIIIAFISIALPISIYLFSIKPSKKALKEFENNADKKMADFLSKSRNKQIEQAIENLKSQNQELINNAGMLLQLTQPQEFTDEHLYKLVMLLKSGDIDQVTKGTIAYIVSNRESNYATDFFSTAIEDKENVNIKNAAIKYFKIFGIK